MRRSWKVGLTYSRGRRFVPIIALSSKSLENVETHTGILGEGLRTRAESTQSQELSVSVPLGDPCLSPPPRCRSWLCRR